MTLFLCCKLAGNKFKTNMTSFYLFIFFFLATTCASLSQMLESNFGGKVKVHTLGFLMEI